MRWFDAEAAEIDVQHRQLGSPRIFKNSLPSRSMGICPRIRLTEENPVLYLPCVESADVIKTLDDGLLRIEIYTNIKTFGVIDYHYMVGVYPSGKKLPLLLVACESSAGLAQEGRGSYALGAFSEAGHATLDVSDDYINYGHFLRKASEYIDQWLASLRTAPPPTEESHSRR